MLYLFRFRGVNMYAENFVYESMCDHVLVDDLGTLPEDAEISFSVIEGTKGRSLFSFLRKEEKFHVLYDLFDRHMVDFGLTAEEVVKNMAKYKGRDAKIFRASSLVKNW